MGAFASKYHYAVHAHAGLLNSARPYDHPSSFDMYILCHTMHFALQRQFFPVFITTVLSLPCLLQRRVHVQLPSIPPPPLYGISTHLHARPYPSRFAAMSWKDLFSSLLALHVLHNRSSEAMSQIR